MRITSKGQVTIPKNIRDELGFLPNTDVEFEVRHHVVRLVKSGKRIQRGQRVVSRLRGSGSGRGKRTTDQIMAQTRGT